MKASEKIHSQALIAGFELNIGKVVVYFKGNRAALGPVFGNCEVFLVTLRKQARSQQVFNSPEPMIRHVPEAALRLFFSLCTRYSDIFESAIVQARQSTPLAVKRKEVKKRGPVAPMKTGIAACGREESHGMSFQVCDVFWSIHVLC
ncbi:MAG: hypothetical protein AAFY25_06965 [Pseudomonadota bacterium]